MKHRALWMIAGFVLAVVAAGFMLLGIWAMLFRSGWLALLAFCAAAALAPLWLRRRNILVTRLAITSLVILATALSFAAWMGQVNRNIARLDRLEADKYSTGDKLGIWGLNGLMAVCGAPFFPEAAVETALLPFRRGPADTIRFRSDFVLNSGTVRAALRPVLTKLDRAGANSEVTFGPIRVYLGQQRDLGPKDWRAIYWETRCFLALNPVTLRGTATREADRWRIALRYTVPVRYGESREDTVPLIPPVRGITGDGLTMRERLFWVLQESGWFFPYIAEYSCVFYSDDPRLTQPGS